MAKDQVHCLMATDSCLRQASPPTREKMIPNLEEIYDLEFGASAGKSPQKLDT
jgi:hypothetical protein